MKSALALRHTTHFSCSTCSGLIGFIFSPCCALRHAGFISLSIKMNSSVSNGNLVLLGPTVITVCLLSKVWFLLTVACFFLTLVSNALSKLSLFLTSSKMLWFISVQQQKRIKLEIYTDQWLDPLKLRLTTTIPALARLAYPACPSVWSVTRDTSLCTITRLYHTWCSPAWLLLAPSARSQRLLLQLRVLSWLLIQVASHVSSQIESFFFDHLRFVALCIFELVDLVHDAVATAGADI